MGARIRASYLIETGLDVVAAAEVMAGEQSSGTFVAIPGETPELRARAGARVESIEELERVSSPSLPGAAPAADGTYTRAHVELSWPLENLGPSLPNLVATVAGNLFELRQFSGLKLLDIKLPDAFASAYPGPAFGVEGTRRLTGVDKRPLIGTIIKPSVGLDAAATADLVDELCAAGIDFIKDDELQADGPHCPFAARVEAVTAVLRRHAERAGRQVMFAFNVTGEVDEVRRRHDIVLEHSGTCIMVSLNSVGLTGFTALRRHAVLPIHAHRNGWGYLSRHPMLGWSYVAWQKLWRLAGADHMHVNGLDNKFCEDNDSVIVSAKACLTPMFEAKPCIAMPVFSSGQSVRQAAATYQALGSVDLIHAAGGGIMSHRDGTAAGVRSLRQAWDAAIAGVPAEAHAREHAELRAAMEGAR